MPATDEYWRSLPRTHKVFAISAVVLLASTLLMMSKDEARPWREIQARAEEYRVERLDKQIAEFNTPERLQQIDEVEAKVKAAQDAWEIQASTITREEQELSELEGKKQILARDSKARNAFRDKARADYDIKVRDESPPEVLTEYRLKFEKAEEAAVLKALELEQVQTRHQALKDHLQKLRAGLDDAESELKKVVAEREALQEQRDLLRPGTPFVAWKRKLKEWPIINGFNPHLKIQYDWAPDLQQTLGMTQVSRVDRCRTCHVYINEFGAGNVPTYPARDYPQPYCAHPNPDLYLTSTSPHAITKFGCTSCHEGDGSGTSFQTAEHTAPNPAVAEEWHKEYDWHSNHFWEYPMFPKQFIESTCLKCHHNVIELGVNEKFGNSAPRVFKGFTTIRDYGCFGCHEINGYDGATPIGPDMRLEPQTPEEAEKYASDPNQVPGTMRKVGPSLRHIGQKTTPEFVAYWTEEPKRFRPTTRMPQFFDLSNQHDAMAAALQPVELAAIASFLMEKSQPIDLMRPAEGYTPNAERGADLFSKRGCLACHSKEGEAFAGIDSTFGPDLSRVHEKLLPGQAGFEWLYTWIKEPTRYHPRTKMPDLFLDPYQDGDQTIDPAADIAQFLLQGGPRQFPPLPVSEPYLGLELDDDFTPEKARRIGIAEGDFGGVLVTDTIAGSPAERAESRHASDGSEQRGDWAPNPILPTDIITTYNGVAVKSPQHFRELEAEGHPGDVVNLTLTRNGQPISVRTVLDSPLNDLVRLYLSKSMTRERVDRVFETRQLLVSPDMYEEGKSPSEFIKGDEIELAPKTYDEEVTPEVWEQRKLQYVGRRTISRYGCYGCHDIAEFESARPIGTALQDWGRKDTSKLAYEHIHEYLEHHGQPNGSSTAEFLTHAVKRAESGENVPEQTLTEAYLYNSVINHGRAGFLWQKLRDPRSYDYRKTETKGWDERLRMPKFPFDEGQIEAVTTFVLGLVADPPPPAYQYRPDGAAGARIAGERLIEKYNCTGCHMLDIPTWEFTVNPEDLIFNELLPEDKKVFDHYSYLKPPQPAFVGPALPDGSRLLRSRGYPKQFPDPEEDPEFQQYSFVVWDPLDLDDGRRIMPGQPIAVAASNVRSQGEGRGGDLAKWLIPRLPGKEKGVKDINEAWQAAPPPLAGEGHKVQTPWLYQFLKNPDQLRFTTVLRMPRFNMSDEEAQELANYFAARDSATFPYQLIPQREAEYQAEQEAEYRHEYPDAEHDFLTASWLALNGPLCRKCHSVGGNELTDVDPSQVKRGPNLQRVERRLRSDYVRLWVYNPQWILPYTSMPQNFPPTAESAMKDLFHGNNPRQAQAVVDALFNYTRLIEEHGETTYNPPGAPPEGATPQANATGGAGGTQ